MQLTTPQAAEFSGKSRSTIWRACRHGRLAARRNKTGDYLIDRSELERVFGPSEPLDPTASDPAPDDRAPEQRLSGLAADWGD